MTFFKKLVAGFAMVVMVGASAFAGGNVEAPVAQVVVVEDTKPFYVGVSTIVGVAGDRTSIDWFGFTSVGVQAGYEFYNAGNFEASVEGRYSTDTANWFDTYNYGLYLKPGYDMGGVTAYGLVGYQDGADTGGFVYDNVIAFQGELAYGGGLTTDIFGLDVFADYLYGDKTQSEVVTVGVNYRF